MGYPIDNRPLRSHSQGQSHEPKLPRARCAVSIGNAWDAMLYDDVTLNFRFAETSTCLRGGHDYVETKLFR
jgi:hypothetical protein